MVTRPYFTHASALPGTASVVDSASDIIRTALVRNKSQKLQYSEGETICYDVSTRRRRERVIISTVVTGQGILNNSGWKLHVLCGSFQERFRWWAEIYIMARLLLTIIKSASLHKPCCFTLDDCTVCCLQIMPLMRCAACALSAQPMQHVRLIPNPVKEFHHP